MSLRTVLISTLAGMTMVSLSGAVHAADSAPELKDPPGFGTLSASVAMTTDYRFRGISQTLRDPAVQGSFDWTLDMFYAGIWGSSIDFGGTDGPGEFDIYAGITPSLAGIDFNFGGIFYVYPGARDPAGGEFNYFEALASAEHDFGMAKAKLAVNYSPDYFGESGDGWFLEGKVTVPLPHSFELSGAAGHQWIAQNAAFGTPDYLTWNVGLSYTWNQFTLDVRYVDTDLSNAECFGGGSPKLCGATGIATVSATF